MAKKLEFFTTVRVQTYLAFAKIEEVAARNSAGWYGGRSWSAACSTR
jgi:hypothetical protein